MSFSLNKRGRKLKRKLLKEQKLQSVLDLFYVFIVLLSILFCHESLSLCGNGCKKISKKNNLMT